MMRDGVKSVFEEHGLDIETRSTESLREKGAVFFLFDSRFVEAFRVLAHSIRDAIEATLFDIVILTNDETLVENATVRSIADRVIFFTDEEIATIAAIKRDAVASHRQHSQLGKYTFLKLLCFNDFGYKHHIFLDTDMICLNADFRFEDLIAEGFDFSAVPCFGSKRLGMPMDALKAELPETVRQNAKADFTRFVNDTFDSITSYNSGVYFAGPRLLHRETALKMIDLATVEAFQHEQTISKTVLAATKGLRWKSMSPYYNTSIRPIYAMGEKLSKPLLDEISILHFNTNIKPWMKPRREADWVEQLWWRAYDESMTPDVPSASQIARKARVALALTRNANRVTENGPLPQV